MFRPALAILLALALSAGLRSGEFNEVLSVGDAAPVWENLPGVDGQQHSLADLKDKDVLVVVFTCNSCPVAIDYEERLLAFANQHASAESRVGVVAINCNLIEEDQLPAMKERAESRGFNFPYLWDETQQIGRDFGAIYTPEFFVLDRDRKVIYMGAMDDNDNPSKVTVDYLDAAVAAALADEAPPAAETLARGCRVRYKRIRQAEE